MVACRQADRRAGGRHMVKRNKWAGKPVQSARFLKSWHTHNARARERAIMHWEDETTDRLNGLIDEGVRLKERARKNTGKVVAVAKDGTRVDDWRAAVRPLLRLARPQAEAHKCNYSPLHVSLALCMHVSSRQVEARGRKPRPQPAVRKGALGIARRQTARQVPASDTHRLRAEGGRSCRDTGRHWLGIHS